MRTGVKKRIVSWSVWEFRQAVTVPVKTSKTMSASSSKSVELFPFRPLLRYDIDDKDDCGRHNPVRAAGKGS